MFNGHKVVVTMTSWTKRIGNCHQVVKSILNNTMKPDAVYLNLSVEEFPKRDQDLPKDLVQLSNEDQTFKINWVEGPNTKSMKKVFPILQFLNDDDLVITCDDDFVIPNDFVKIRVLEFIEHGCTCAITSSNRRDWHYRTLYGQKYWAIGSGSIFSKKMLGNHQKILTDKIINTYNDDVIYAFMILSNGFWIEPTKTLSNGSGVGPRKISYIDDNVGMTRKKSYEMNLNVILSAFESSFNQYSPQVNFQRKITQTVKLHNINLVIFDSLHVAGDNGEYLYRVIREQYPSVNITFLIDPESRDYTRLKQDGFNVKSFSESGKFISKATFVLMSKELGGNNSTQQLLRLYRDKCIFLGHGVTSVLSDDSSYIKNSISSFNKFMCCTSDIEASLIRKYSNGHLFPITCGFPRHDVLLKKSVEWKKSKGGIKCVFITFHYRRNPSQSYFNDINNLLASQEIKRLHEKGIKIFFMPHALFMNRIKQFKVPKYIDVPINSPFQDILAKSDVLITDVSSNNFEMAYMNKPTIMYIPGYSTLKHDAPHYHIENHKLFSHIFFCKTQKDVFAKIQNLLNTDPRMFNFASKIFKYVDTNNTQRLIEWMLNKIEQQKKQGSDSKPNIKVQKQQPKDFRRFQFC